MIVEQGSPRPASTTAPPQAASSLFWNLADGGKLIHAAAPVSSLTDVVAYGTSTGSTRVYWINLTASVAIPLLPVALETSPLVDWGLPNQMPGGADVLPPLSLWTWTIYRNGVTDTNLWTSESWDETLHLDTTWVAQSFKIVGTTSPVISVTVNPWASDGTTAPGTGVVLNTPGTAAGIPAGDPNFEPLAAALHPQIIRSDAVTVGLSLTWDKTTGQPKYNFTGFDSLMKFAWEVHSQVLFAVPAGTWGDGNLLPAGMPLNKSLLITAPTGTGYLPTNSAYVTYLDGLLNHVIAKNEHIAYWTIGNEFPTTSTAQVAAFTNLFNVAAQTIHAKLSTALVGSDVMTSLTYENYFAVHARGVGFLSYHYYPVIGMCFKNGKYCAPEGPPSGTTDPGLFAHSAYAVEGRNYAPLSARDLWFNITGRHVPIFNAEANLNGAGGSPSSQGNGSDPRIQTTFGAAWVDSLLIDSAFQDVTDVTYFTFSNGATLPQSATSAWGGWGFGLTNDGTHGNYSLYAPYYALQLWAASIPPGAPGRSIVNSEPSVVYAYAARDTTNFSVVLVNRVNVPVSIDVSLNHGSYALSSVSVLDKQSYDEAYNPTLQRVVLDSSGVAVSHPSPGTPVTIDGYGVAVVHYTSTTKGEMQSSSPTGGADSGAPAHGTSNLSAGKGRIVHHDSGASTLDFGGQTTPSFALQTTSASGTVVPSLAIGHGVAAASSLSLTTILAAASLGAIVGAATAVSALRFEASHRRRPSHRGGSNPTTF